MGWGHGHNWVLSRGKVTDLGIGFFVGVFLSSQKLILG